MHFPQELLPSLNSEQRAAVTAPLGNLLILAGAGSGKTRTLILRMVWLILQEGCAPESILAVTFTNKAAQEMRERLQTVLGRPVNDLWVGTFHGIAHRLLRINSQLAGLNDNFQIVDSDDQQRILKRLLREAKVDEDILAAKKLQIFVNQQKEQGIRAANTVTYIPQGTLLQSLYQRYEQYCLQNNVVDFSELLLRVQELLLNHPEVLQRYQTRFQQILVDEFQDTNAIQYAWLSLLNGGRQNTLIVGDDDQSIYGWRGAKVENIQRFVKDFPQVNTIRLEQNYRSTSTILKAANSVIEHNTDRLGKQLWTSQGAGDSILLYAGYNDLDEAQFIVKSVQKWCRENHKSYQECAVLYRSNAQSRVMEEALLKSNIPYRIYGGLRFFERAEIKDALAYLRLIHLPHDDAAFERVINTPTRGIGQQTLQTIQQYARENELSLFAAAHALLSARTLAARAHVAVESFILLIQSLMPYASETQLQNIIEPMLKQSGLMEQLQTKNEKDLARLENLQELLQAAEQFNSVETDMTVLASFLAHTVLDSGEVPGEHQEAVQLMTLHSAKGLEFSLVILAGMEEGIFPHHFSMNDEDRLAEERRLCYVGMTRAMQTLILTYAENRRMHGTKMAHMPSRFLKEIPKALIRDVRAQTQIKRPSAYYSAPVVESQVSPWRDDFSEEGFKLGENVWHAQFGQGVILNISGQGETARLQIRFNDVGTKWLLAQYVKNSESC